MKIGYARVSTDEQNLQLQVNALEIASCDVIYKDSGVSGNTFERPALKEALQTLSGGDQLVVWKLDRLGRSLHNLIETVTALEKRQIGLHSISEAIDTSSPGGVLIFHIMGALAQFERSLISERTKAGMAAARASGQALGRPRKLSSDQIAEVARRAGQQRGSMAAIARQFGVSRTTLYRVLREASP